MAQGERLFVKVTRELLPQVKDKYPFLYLERGRLEIDDSSVKWVDADGNVVPLPVATINTLLLGPGTTVTHEAIKPQLRLTARCAGWARIACCFMPPVFCLLQIPAILKRRWRWPAMHRLPSRLPGRCLLNAFRMLIWRVKV